MNHKSLAAALLMAGTLLDGVPASAQRTLDIREFNADIVVHRDGSMTVTETLRVHFTGSWNGIIRSIPVEYSTGYGANYTLRLGVQSAQDDAGADLRYEAERSGRSRVFRIWVPGAVDATKTVVFRYRVANGLRFFDEHDELYWNVTGDESEFPIRSASANVYVPEQAVGLRAAAFTGPRGATGSDARIEHNGNLIRVAATRQLEFREGLTIVVGWDPGVVDRPTAFDRARGLFYSNFLFAMPLLAFGLMFGMWRRHGRDPHRRAIAPIYEPPESLTPGEVGTLIDERPDMRDVTATIVDLCVRGFLRIEETREEHLLGLFSSQDYAFHLVRPRTDWNSLKPHEVELLSALFSGRDSVAASKLENSFYKDLPDISRHLQKTLVRDGHYLRQPSTVRAIWIAVGVGAGVLVAAGGGALLSNVFGQEPASAVVAGVLTAAVVGGFGLIMPARTHRGARMVEQLLGFQEFLRRVESDRFERVIKTPEMFERFLPYAMALGVESNWARAFDDIYSTPPDWYRSSSPHGFRCHVFTGNLSRMAAVTGSAMKTAPRSSSSGSSGFGGGGSSGGGFGGGGVGGF